MTLSLNMPSLKMLDRYSDLSRGIFLGVPDQVRLEQVLLKVREEGAIRVNFSEGRYECLVDAIANDLKSAVNGSNG